MPYIQPRVEFYYAPGACSLAPHILLQLSSLQYEAIPFRPIPEGHPLPDSFKLVNPKQRVPVITLSFPGENSDKKEVITETPAVMTAISQLVPSLHLMERTDIEKVKVLEWMNYLSGTLHGQGFGMMFRPGRFSSDTSAHGGIMKRGKEMVEESFGFIEGRLRAGKWAMGDSVSGVDAYLLVFWRWGVQVGWKMGVKWPNYTGLVKKVADLDAMKATLEVEGLEMAF